MYEIVEYFVFPVIHGYGNVIECFIVKLAYFGVPLLDALTSGCLVALLGKVNSYSCGARTVIIMV